MVEYQYIKLLEIQTRILYYEAAKNRILAHEAIQQTLTALIEADVNDSIMVDASHGNSQKQFKKQIDVVNDVAGQISDGNQSLKRHYA